MNPHTKPTPGGARKGAGRPRKPRKVRLWSVSVSLTFAQRLAIKALAARKKQSVSETVRGLLFEEDRNNELLGSTHETD